MICYFFGDFSEAVYQNVVEIMYCRAPDFAAIEYNDTSPRI
jgi:hypothetical protein